MPRVERQAKSFMLPIGDWNMAENEMKSVPHKFTLSEIFSVSAMVRNDTDSKRYQAMGVDGGLIQLEIESIDETNINLKRKNGGVFDNEDFDSVAYNRGWVSINFSPGGAVY